MPMLDFRVETFLAVCRHMNFTKAARELNITQPAVSHHMHYLEQAYGTALFQHNGKRLQLTEAGEILRRTLMTMKHDEQHLQKRMQQVASGTRDYSFGATLSVAEFMINEALGRFLRLHPDSHIQMQVADTKVLLSKLDSGELDFAVVEGDFPKAEYDFFVFGTEEYVAAGDPEKAARYRGRPLTDLLGEPLLGIYTSNPEVVSYGLIRLKYVCATYFLCGLMDVMVGTIRGMGYSIMPMLVSLTGACAFRVIWIFTIFQMDRTLDCLYISYPISWVLTAGVHLICYFAVRKKAFARAAAQ